ncbi:WYL domain-containing protein [Shewanella avicenniae]|uniref:WYL domain-containing protein n=1 Tax=Shewanella avicenniae TaxID=2814294 RepID=A0ABX7QU54_9GAMM|nr:WYL domain-containing protein [Shewanella avicenniae]QSX35028.1 WYL domain-containing protein [Shewanella avicenniae]
MSRLDEINHAQKQRLAFIDFCLQYFGQISRQDLITKFATGLAAATRDLALYRELAPDNLKLVHPTRHYQRQPQFKALFEHDPQAILTGLARGFGDGLSQPLVPSRVCIDAQQLIHPKPDVIAAVMRAIQQGVALQVSYVSTSSGESVREIVPHSLINNGQRWHVRAYDRTHKLFTDFVVTRIKQVRNELATVAVHEQPAADSAWLTPLELVLIPHPSLRHPEAIALDYGMQQGELKLHSNAALAAYLLRSWSVDCSAEHKISSGVCQLALKNTEILTKLEHLSIVPGANS